ncbi:VanZ family protein [Marinilabilia sp.]|uniref:VanZ family protein n=1 Tax=Marinilabilia sp. TaxID=2021252 RepID=UPI0025BD1C2A|nr:VanZ family protein [Marinilabilia sp.]
MNKISQFLINYKLTLITVGIIFFLSLSSSESINKVWFLDFKFSDKLAHLGMYGFLTLVYLIERTAFLRSSQATRKTRWFYVWWIVLIGAGIEFLQPIIVGRDKDFWDFTSNTIGILLAYLLFFYIKKYYNFNKTSSS